MASIFSCIINGEIPCYKIAEDKDNFAFLDINPLVEGHTLVVPKLEIDNLFDLPDERLASLIVFAKKVAAQIAAAVPCQRIGMTVIGLDVPHAHIHLIPLDGVEDMDFSRPKLKFSEEEFLAVQQKIRSE